MNNHANIIAAINAYLNTAVQPQSVSETNFYLRPYDTTTNAALIQIAEAHGYEAGVITDSGETWLEFMTAS